MTTALAGILAGVVHVFSGPDHLAAIAPYAVADPARSWRTGVRWGLGHGTAVLAVGLVVLAARRAVPVEVLSARGELGVGLALLAIGGWGIHAAHRGRPGHGHRRAPFAVGTLHGLAGSSHVVGMLPALALASDAVAGGYLLSFGAGSVAAMGTFAAMVGGIAGRRAIANARAQRALLCVCSAAAVAIGGYWVVTALRPLP